MIAEVVRLGLWRGQSTCDVPAFLRSCVPAFLRSCIPAFLGAELGHPWVVAPPLIIVDGTIRLQNPPGDS
jgi:hypothetical protein